MEASMDQRSLGMKLTTLRAWAGLLLLGLTLAVIGGGWRAWPTVRSQDYLSVHLYCTAADLLAGHINRMAGYVLGSLLLIGLGGQVWRSRLRARVPAQPDRQVRRYVERLWLILMLPGLLAFLGINVAAWGLHIANAHTAAPRPPIIFIMIDTLRADHVGCYGYDVPTTPHIDALARHSLRFEHAISQAPYTLWSVASMMSSRYPESLFPFDIEMPGNGMLFPVMLAEVLRDRGYATVAVISNPLIDRTSLVAQGFDRYDDATAQLPPDVATAAQVTQSAIRHLDALHDQPVFLSLVYMDPHQPYLAHPGYRYGPSARAERVTQALAAKYPANAMATRRETMRMYDAEIGYTDHQIGVLLQALKARGIYDSPAKTQTKCLLF